MDEVQYFLEEGQKWEKNIDAQEFIGPMCQCINLAGEAYMAIKESNPELSEKKLVDLTNKALNSVRKASYVNARCQGYSTIYNMISKTNDLEAKGLIGMEIADDIIKEANNIIQAEKMFNIALKFVNDVPEALSYVHNKVRQLALESAPHHSTQLLSIIK